MSICSGQCSRTKKRGRTFYLNFGPLERTAGGSGRRVYRAERDHWVVTVQTSFPSRQTLSRPSGWLSQSVRPTAAVPITGPGRVQHCTPLLHAGERERHPPQPRTSQNSHLAGLCKPCRTVQCVTLFWPSLSRSQMASAQFVLLIAVFVDNFY